MITFKHVNKQPHDQDNFYTQNQCYILSYNDFITI